MNANEEANRSTMARWYNEMWGKADSTKIKDCIAPEYLRHDVTGANNVVTAESYGAMVSAGMQGKTIHDFTYVTVVEGDFIGTLGRYLHGDNEQWDWVQLFRTNNNRLAETWLPGMGGTQTLAYPILEYAWSGSEIPAQDQLPLSKTKNVVREWFQHLAAGTDATACLCPSVRTHDMLDMDAELDAAAFQNRWRSLMQHDTASGLKLFVMEENDIAFATGMWSLGADERQWNWVQAFRLKNDQIAETWITSIGGTDVSIAHSADPLWGHGILPANATRFGAKVPVEKLTVQT